jgi:hypothetical protein
MSSLVPKQVRDHIKRLEENLYVYDKSLKQLSLQINKLSQKLLRAPNPTIKAELQNVINSQRKSHFEYKLKRDEIARTLAQAKQGLPGV